MNRTSKQLPSKLPAAGTTIFSVMSALAKEHNAINLSQGFPDFDCSAELLELADGYMKQGFNQYAPMPGALQLRQTIASIMQNAYGAFFNPDTEITVTAGATQALYTAIAAFIHPGDEVITFEPAYDCYRPAIELHGGVVKAMTLQAPDFTVDWDSVRKAVSSRTRMILINTPHNPTGATLSNEDLLQLQEIVANSDIILLSDEVYEHMVFDGARHESVARYPALRENLILVSSFGKTVHTTGWKIGYVAAGERLMAEIRKVHQYLVFAVNHPLQLALSVYLDNSENYTRLKDFYQAKRDLFRSFLEGSRFRLLPCRGTYFQLLDYSEVSGEKDTEFAVRLTREHKLASVPLSVFYQNGSDSRLLRFCFAKRDETLKSASDILNAL